MTAIAHPDSRVAYWPRGSWLKEVGKKKVMLSSGGPMHIHDVDVIDMETEHSVGVIIPSHQVETTNAMTIESNQLSHNLLTRG